MNIFGIHLSRAKADEDSDGRRVLSKRSDNPLFGGYTGIPNEVYRNKTIYAKVLDNIRLPDPGSLLEDPWKQVEFNRLMKKFIDMLEGKYFCVSSLGDLKEFYDGKRVYDTWRNLEAYKKLNSIHCVHYSDMPKDVIKDIVPFINEVLNHGNVVEGKTGFCNDPLQLK